MSSYEQRRRLMLPPEKLSNELLVSRLLKRAYGHGWSAQKNGAESGHAKNLKRLVERDRDELLRRLGALTSALDHRDFTVSCVICGKERKSRGFHFENALFAAADDDTGWAARYSESGEWIELLCPEHARTPAGAYES